MRVLTVRLALVVVATVVGSARAEEDGIKEGAVLNNQCATCWPPNAAL